MRAYVVAIAALLTGAGPAFAEPAKGEAIKPAQEQAHPVQIVLASAEPMQPQVAPAAQPASSPAKRHIAPRVTTCRCGDPKAGADDKEQ